MLLRWLLRLAWKRAGEEIGGCLRNERYLIFPAAKSSLYSAKRLGNRRPPKRWIAYAESHAVLVTSLRHGSSYALYHYGSVIGWKWRGKLPASTSFVCVLAANVRTPRAPNRSSCTIVRYKFLKIPTRPPEHEFPRRYQRNITTR